MHKKPLLSRGRFPEKHRIIKPKWTGRLKRFVKKPHIPKFRWLQKSERWQQIKQHPIALPLVFFMTLAVVSVSLFLIVNGGQTKFKPISSYVVIISHDHEEQTVPTNEPTVGALLKKLGLVLNTGDVVEPSATTRISQDNFRINIYRAVPVEIIDGGQITYTFSAATTPRAIVQQAGITVYPEDYVTSNMTDDIATAASIDTQIVIDPAVPINLNVYGTQTTIRTHATTVAQLLSEENITLGGGDSVQPAPTTPLTSNMQVFLLHQGQSIQTVLQTIPMPVQTILDNSLTFGTSAIRQQGSSGQQLVTYEINPDGSRNVIQTVVTIPPVTEIVAEGQAVQIPSDKEAVMAEAGIASSDYKYVNYIVSNESGWCPTKLQGEIGYCPSYVPNYIPSYLGYGLGQATPGDKMAPFGSDWESNPVTQLLWATSYADGRYGSWAAAYDHWYDYHNW